MIFAVVLLAEVFEMAETLQSVVNAAAQAAQAAAAAALSLETMAKAKEDKGTRYGEASKVIRMPDPYGSDFGDVETDQARWSEFALGFKSWLFYADPKFEAELDYVEANVKTEVKLGTMSDESKPGPCSCSAFCQDCFVDDLFESFEALWTEMGLSCGDS